MNARRNGRPQPRTLEQVTEAQDRRAAIATQLTRTPRDEDALRRAVWTFVGTERHAGTSPGHVIIALTDLISATRLDVGEPRQALTRQLVLWCVEAYFGHLGGDVLGGERGTLADIVSPVPRS